MKAKMTRSQHALLSNPFEASQNIEYRSAIVTFVDILGFRALVTSKSAADVAAAITRLQESIHPISPGLPQQDGPKTIHPSRVHAFSDCVVRVRPVAGDDDFGPIFIRELSELASIQAALASAGVFVRGGIAYGQIHSTDLQVFGPALIRAYELESSLAHVPRIVIDPVAIQTFRDRAIPKSRMRQEITGMRRSIRQADDGLWFIDYLHAGAESFEGDVEKQNFFALHRQRITAAAASVDIGSSVLPKYLWAAQYHNATCKRVLGRTSIPGVTLSKAELPSFERLRPPIVVR